MRRAFALSVGVSALLLLSAAFCRADESPEPGSDVPTPDASGVQQSAPAPGMSAWFDPTKLPFIPVPEIASDPNGGTTIGVLPVWLKTDEEHVIRRIIAPDFLYNPYFGYGAHARYYSYNSENQQWSVLGHVSERVQRGLDAEFQDGRLRLTRWSFNGSVIADRDGTPRFFGIGNNTPEFAQTNYTAAQKLAQVQVGLNLTPRWQALYTGRARTLDVLPGTLENIPSIQTRFPRTMGLGTRSELLNRMSIVYDSRDSLTAPQRGMEWVLYGGAASRQGLLNDSLYTEAGIDGRDYLRLSPNTILATHISLRYMPTAHDLPFWAFSSLGGGESDVGGEQLLRGFGSGRFYGRNSFSSTAELRRNVWSFNTMATHVDIEVTPFVDLGQVFARTSTFPVEQLHKVGGVGFRGIARPSVVGYVDVGYGSEGAAVFTGINYPF